MYIEILLKDYFLIWLVYWPVFLSSEFHVHFNKWNSIKYLFLFPVSCVELVLNSPSFSPGPSAFIFILTLDIPSASVGRPSITGTFISKEKWTISDIQESRDSLPVWLFSTATAGGSSGCVCLCNLSSAPCQPPSSPWGAPESALPNTGLPPRNNGSALFNGGLNPKTFGKGAGIIIEWRCFVDIVSVTTGNTTLKDYWLDNLFSFFNYYSVNRLRCDPFVFLPSKEH